MLFHVHVLSLSFFLVFHVSFSTHFSLAHQEERHFSFFFFFFSFFSLSCQRAALSTCRGMSKDFVLPPRRRFTSREKRRNAEVELFRSAWASEHGLRMVHKLERARRGDTLVGGAFSFGRAVAWFDKSFLTSLPTQCLASGARHTATTREH